MQTDRGLAETLQCPVWAEEHPCCPRLFAEESGLEGLEVY